MFILGIVLAVFALVSIFGGITWMAYKYDNWQTAASILISLFLIACFTVGSAIIAIEIKNQKPIQTDKKCLSSPKT